MTRDPRRPPGGVRPATKFDDLPDAVVIEARRRLIDAFALALAGALDEPAPTIAAQGRRGRLRPSRRGALRRRAASADWAAFRQRRAYPPTWIANDTYSLL